MKVDLFCVQPYMEWTDYIAKEAFYHKIDRFFQAASLKRTPDRPAIIVFPEDLATFLLLEGQHDVARHAKTMDEAFTLIGKKKRLAVMAAMVRYRTHSLKRAFFISGSPRVWHIWHGTMSRLAHQYRMTVVAGSALLPDTRWSYDVNQYSPKNSHVYNLSFTVGPDGHIFYHTRKVNLVPTQEDLLDLSAGQLESAIKPAPLPGTHIPLATAICYDGFREPHTNNEPHFVNVIEAMDRAGARLIAQPSANPWWWDQPWPLDTKPQRRLRSQQWDDEGSMTALKFSHNIEIIINSHLLLEFLDLHFDGESRILARQGDAVHMLVKSRATRGPEAETVLHSEWDFALNASGESKI